MARNRTYVKPISFRKKVEKESKIKETFDEDFFGHGISHATSSSVEALQKYRLDWEVALTHIRTDTISSNLPRKDKTSRDPNLNDIRCFENRAVIRTDTFAPMGTVGSRYELIQNSHAVSMFDELLAEGKVELYSGGHFLEGQQCYVTFKIPGEINIGSEVILKFIVLTWSHDGTSVLSANFVPYLKGRKVSLASYVTDNTISNFECRHTSGAKDRILKAREAYIKAIQFFEKFTTMIKDIADKDLSMERLEEVLLYLYPSKDEDEVTKNKNGKSRSCANEKKRDEIVSVLETEVPASIRHTELGALIAINQHFDHNGRIARRKDPLTGGYRRSVSETRLHSSLFGSGAKSKEKAVKTLLNFDEIKEKAEEARKRRDAKKGVLV